MAKTKGAAVLPCWAREEAHWLGVRFWIRAVYNALKALVGAHDGEIRDHLEVAHVLV